MTFFIIMNNDPRCVWNYAMRDWASDIDAEYGNGFEYGSNRSVHDAAFLIKLKTPSVVLDVVTRDELFKMLDVNDWAGASR